MIKLHVYSQSGDLDQHVVVEGDSATIGRSSECNVVIDRKDISRQHARLLRGWVVDDLNSRNGTHVDGVKIDAATPISTRCFELGDPTSNNLVTVEVVGADRTPDPVRDASDSDASGGNGSGPTAPKPAAEAQALSATSGNLQDLRAQFDVVTEQYRSKCAQLEIELAQLRRKLEAFQPPTGKFETRGGQPSKDPPPAN